MVPGQQVGVMLARERDHGGAAGKAVRQQVQGVCGVTGEDDVIFGPRPDEVADGLPGLLVLTGAALRKRSCAAMD